MTDLASLIARLLHRATIAHLSYYTNLGENAELDREAATALETLRSERDAAILRAIEHDRARGEAEGKLAMSEAAGIVEGWRERAEKAEAALKPFAEYMGDMDRDNLGNPLPDDAGVGWVYLTQGDFRRARAALQSQVPK